MNNPEHLTYSVDKNRLRMGAAVGVIVITAGFALGSVMHTSSSSANEPTSSVTDNTIATDEIPITGNGSDQNSDNATSSVANNQPVADKESVANETEPAGTDADTEAEEAEAEDTEAEEADAEEADETDADEAEETDAEEADETDNDDEGTSNGLGWDLGLVFPGDILDELIDPFPLPDDLGPIGPIGPINPPSPPSPIDPPSSIGYDTGPIGTPSPIDPLLQMWSELSGHIN